MFEDENPIEFNCQQLFEELFCKREKAIQKPAEEPALIWIHPDDFPPIETFSEDIPHISTRFQVLHPAWPTPKNVHPSNAS